MLQIGKTATIGGYRKCGHGPVSLCFQVQESNQKNSTHKRSLIIIGKDPLHFIGSRINTSHSEIAVITGEDGRTIPITGPGTVVIYRRTHGEWQRGRTFPFALESGIGLEGLRRKMAELVAFLGECRAFAAKSAGGAVYFELERARCHVWEIAGRPEEFLDSVCLEVNKNGERDACTPAATTDAGIPVPMETAPGKYTLSIVEIQRKRSGVSSKQVLQQFIRRAVFTELEIICEHIPPWVGVEAEFLGLRVETEQSSPCKVRVLLKKPE